MENSQTVLSRKIKLKDYVTIGCGGEANVYFPKTVDQLKYILLYAKERGLKIYPLGNGSNVLPNDGAYKGIVVSFKQLKGYRVQDNVLTACAGESIAFLNHILKEKNISFAPFLYGVPALVCGAIAMNAGVSSFYMENIVKKVYATDGKKDFQLSLDECKFGSKDSVFLHSDLLIYSADFIVTSNDNKKIEDEFNFFKERRKHLPQGKSMGCVFRNEYDTPSGMLIEQSGLKGKRVGGAVVSNEHGNFIINENDATAEDIKKLIAIVKNTVLQKTGKKLTEEIRYFA